MTDDAKDRLQLTQLHRMRPGYGWSLYHRKLGQAVARHLGDDWQHLERAADDYRIAGPDHQQIRLAIDPSTRTVTFTTVNPAPHDTDGTQGIFNATAAPEHLAQWIRLKLLPDHQRAIAAWQRGSAQARQRAHDAARRLGPHWQVATGDQWATAYASGDAEGIFGELTFYYDGTATVELHGIPEINADRVAGFIEEIDWKDPA